MQKIASICVFAFLCSLPVSAFAESSDSIEILTPWSERSDNTLRILIINTADLSEEKISIIKKVINSDVSHTENGHIYFEGWTGALRSLNSNIKKFEITVSEEKIAGSDIVLELSKEMNGRYNGWTTPQYVGNHLTGAYIQIFDSENISSSQLENLSRHELGHALGLGHATEKNALMYPSMGSEPKFISYCEISGLEALSGGMTFRDVDCS